MWQPGGRRRYGLHALVLSIALLSVVLLGGRIGPGVRFAGGTEVTQGFAFMVPPEAAGHGASVSSLEQITGPVKEQAGGGASSTAEAATSAAEPVQFTTHAVAPGDTLSTIGERYGVDTQYLIWNNPEVGADPNYLLVGEELVVPSVPGIVYNVKLGDTVSDIATTYGIDTSAIISYAPNKLDQPDLILEGKVLVLPGGVPPAPAPVVPEDAPVPVQPFTPAEPVGAPSAPAAVVRQAAAPVSAGFIWPGSGRVNSGFGPRWGSFHSGIDISARSGTAVAAAGSGQVVLATYGGGYGYYIIVSHGGGLETVYAHLSDIYVSLGQYVSQGEIIGASGCTGWCTGPHLHFEVRVGNSPVNPVPYLP
jgi:murein DD-endopeptidase MepM/ murein hydrolase activator NlpD